MAPAVVAGPSRERESIMRVDPATALRTALVGLLRSTKVPSRSGFAADAPRPAPQPPGQPTTAVPAGSVAMLVALASQQRSLNASTAARRASRGLDELARLHRGICAGASPPEAFDRLRDWVGEQGEAEGELGALLLEIELRVLVEIAKANR